MKTNNTTTWFTNGEKPAYVGVYNVSCRKENQTGQWYSYWNGKGWHPFAITIDRAYVYSTHGSGEYTNEEGSWRGLASKPEGFEV